MIIILNGSIGVGKTAVSWLLLDQLDSCVMLDGDYYGAVNPFVLGDKNRTDYLYRTLGNMIHFHKDNGYKNFIVNYVFEEVEELSLLKKYLREADDQVHSFCLTCSLEVQRNRIIKRGNDQVDWELDRAITLNDILSARNINGVLGEWVETTDLSVREIAIAILAKTDF